jgi:hypothetical protein
MASPSLPRVPGDPAAVRLAALKLSGAAEHLGKIADRAEAQVNAIFRGRHWVAPNALEFLIAASQAIADTRSLGRVLAEASQVLGQFAARLEAAQQARADAQFTLDKARVETAVMGLLGPLSSLAGLNPDQRAAEAEAAQAVAMAQRTAAVAAAEVETLAGLPVRLSTIADPKPRLGHRRRPGGVLGFATDFAQGLSTGIMAPVQEAVDLFPGWALVDRDAWMRSLEAQGAGLRLELTHPDQLLKALVDWNDFSDGHPAGRSGSCSPGWPCPWPRTGPGRRPTGWTPAPRRRGRQPSCVLPPSFPSPR